MHSWSAARWIRRPLLLRLEKLVLNTLTVFKIGRVEDGGGKPIGPGFTCGLIEQQVRNHMIT